MYLLTIRDGLVTLHIGPYTSPKQAVDDLDRLLASFGERARWQIHELEEPGSLLDKPKAPKGREPQSLLGAAASPVAA
ncbi:hypothetical protein [Synechococcus sp. EJ6-Ellesmere]|uniref:hypothetical protein n=1 Tax=Synechococcus sp. EJ6-Ellesmere TaxID=2823734 RepID=UPI0020CC7BBB|nr:hypothetical protein [Synechococcus sp. EJ6-Ellesmere]MCP9824299.1 hypothetical protein [Synechococcus sp. EJ6-Ellesmere]